MEYGLRGMILDLALYSDHTSLKPCFNGIWSARDSVGDFLCVDTDVLILVLLVLMEYGLRGCN